MSETDKAPAPSEAWDSIANAIMGAFVRGYEWRGENPDAADYLTKAAFDHSDAATSRLIEWLESQKP